MLWTRALVVVARIVKKRQRRRPLDAVGMRCGIERASVATRSERRAVGRSGPSRVGVIGAGVAFEFEQLFRVMIVKNVDWPFSSRTLAGAGTMPR